VGSTPVPDEAVVTPSEVPETTNPTTDEAALESSNDEEEPVVETTVRTRGRPRKSAPVKPTPSRKSTRSKPVEKEPVEAESEAVVESSNDEEEPVVQTRRGRPRKSAPVTSTPSRKSTRSKPEEKEPVQAPQIKSKRRRLEVQEVAEAQPTKRRSVRQKAAVDYNENKEHEEAAPVSIEQEVAPLAEPATEESQEVAVGDKVGDEIANTEEAVEGSSTLTSDRDVVAPNEVPQKTEDSMTETPADEEPQTGVKSEIPKLQRASVVLVDLKATCQESTTPGDESQEPKIEAEKEHTQENEAEKEKGEGVEEETPEVEPAPESVEEEEQVEGLTQEPPLTEPVTEESQEVAAVEMVEDEIIPSKEAEEVSTTPLPDSTSVTSDEPLPVSVEEKEQVGVTEDTPLAEPATEESQEVQRVEDEIANNEETEEVGSTPVPDEAVVTPSEVPETTNPTTDEAALESSNDEEEPVVETTVRTRGRPRKSAPVKPTPSRKSTRSKPVEKEPVEAESEAVVESSNDEEEPVVQTRRGRPRKSAPVTSPVEAPQIKSKRRRTEVEEVEEVQPAKRRSARQKAEVDYKENKEDGEAAPVPVEQEVAPLAEPATEESQEVTAVESVDDETIQNEEAQVTPATPNLQRTTVVLVDLKSTGHEPQVDQIDETTPETKRRSMRERPKVDYDENSDDDIKTVSTEAVIDSNDEEDKITELTADEETEKPVDEGSPQRRRSTRQVAQVDYDENSNDEETEKPEEEEAANGIDVISGGSEEDNVIKLALEDDEEEEKAEAAEEKEGEPAASEESPVVGKRTLRGKTSPPVTRSPSPKSPKVETRALRSRAKADADTPKRRRVVEEPVEEAETRKRRSTRQRMEIDYSEDFKEATSDGEEQEKRLLRKRRSAEPTPVRRSKRGTN